MKVGIIGGGRVGSRLAASLREAGVLVGITAASEQHSAQLAQQFGVPATDNAKLWMSLIHISEPTRLRRISYAVFCLKKNKIINKH